MLIGFLPTCEKRGRDTIDTMTIGIRSKIGKLSVQGGTNGNESNKAVNSLVQNFIFVCNFLYP